MRVFARIRGISGLLAAIAVAGGLAVAAPAPEDEPIQLEKFVVTGSMIKRIEGEGALPVLTLKPLELEQRGVGSIEQMLMNLNLNGNGLDNLAANADVVAGAQRGNNGATSANLRGQGANATLVLLNGRRVSAHGLNGSVVDLNQIPFAAIERVEVLKDGASATYGTDAIGGVINFILKENYQGAMASAATDITEAGGGAIFRYSVLAGFGDLNRDRYNILTSVSYADARVLRGDERDFVNTFQPERGLSPDTRGTPIATLFAITTLHSGLSRDNLDNTGRSTGPADPANPALRVNGINLVDLPGGSGYAGLDGMGPYDELLWNSAASKYGAAWDTGRAAVLQQPVKNTHLVTRGTFKVAARHRLTLEGVFGRSVSNKSFSPNQWSSSTAATTTAMDGKTVLPNPLYNLAYPATGASYDRVFDALVAYFPELAANRGLPLAFRWRSLPLGNRSFTTRTDTFRVLAGMDGPLGFLSQWDYRFAVSRAESESRSTLTGGYVYTVPFVNLINSGAVDIFAYEQTPEAMAAINRTRADGVTLYGGTYRTDEADFTATGPLFELPAGNVQAAVGLDWREEGYFLAGDSRGDLGSPAALIFNAPFDNALATDGTLERTIHAVFVELQIPLLPGLDLNLAGRIDDYAGFGSSANPKVTVRYAPTEKFLARASYGTGFRVPTFKQLLDPVTESPLASTGLIDPATGQVIPPNTVTTLFGGNRDLQPEDATMFSAGIVVQPAKAFSANLDGWAIERTGTIQSFGVTELLQNYGLFADRFFRRPDGTIAAIDTRWINANKTLARGLELGLQGEADAGSGKLTASFDLSYLLDKKTKLRPDAPWGADEVNRFTRSGDLGLRWKHTAALGYHRGPWSFLLNHLYRSAYTDAVLPGVANGLVTPPNWRPEVEAYSIYGFSVTYRGIRHLTLVAGVKNLFDEDPPFSANYDANTGAGNRVKA